MPEELSAEELSRRDGKDGRPVYICHKGRIIDVSESPL
jgi:predicted heme/steroid binding protein